MKLLYLFSHKNETGIPNAVTYADAGTYEKALAKRGIVPFVIGIVWMFASPKNFAAKLFLGAATLIIIASIIMSTDFHLMTMTLFDWVLLLVLIFGGLGMIFRVLLTKH